MQTMTAEKNDNVLNYGSIVAQITESEQYREHLVKICMQYFRFEKEYAEDCVQKAYTSLYEKLYKGVQIRDCKAWLYSVTMKPTNG